MALELTQVLLDTLSPDGRVRKKAEDNLKQIEEQNLASFLLSLSQEVRSDEKPPDSRRVAGLAIKISLDANDSAQKQELVTRWVALDSNVKGQIKSALAQTLESPVGEARQTAAEVIFKIASIELSQKELHDLVASLLANKGGSLLEQPVHFKQSTLEAPGNVCEEEYPTLGPPSPSSWQERIEKRIAELAIEAKTQKELVENRMAGMEIEMKSQKDLLFVFCERDILILAGEILKWSVKKRGESDGEGLQLFDSHPDVKRMVFLGCRAFGDYGRNPRTAELNAFKNLSKEVIKARNATAHCKSLVALERLVHSCSLAIKKWPELERKYPTQVKIISKYSVFKQYLPDSFQ